MDLSGWFGKSVRRERRHGSSSSSKRHHGSSHSIHSGFEPKKSHSIRSLFGGEEPAARSSSHSFFGLGERRGSPRPSIFGTSSSSYYKRSPRKGYIHKILSQLRRLWRDLIYYLKKNPFKVFMLVILPLITGGALTGLLSRFGLRLPASIERLIAKMGGSSGASMGGTSIGRGRDGALRFQREKYEGPTSGLGKAVGAMGGASGLMRVAKMFV